MEEVLCLPPYGKKKEPKNLDILHAVSQNFFKNPNMSSYKQIYNYRTQYAWLADKEENLLNNTFVKELRIDHIVKGIYFSKIENKLIPISHYTYVIIGEGVAYLDFVTSFLLNKGILKSLFPKMIEKMKLNGVNKIKLVPYTEKNLKVFQEKFGFRKQGSYLVRKV